MNTSNLAAVASIVFGILRLAAFINYMLLPNSAPLAAPNTMNGLAQALARAASLLLIGTIGLIASDGPESISIKGRDIYVDTALLTFMSRCYALGRALISARAASSMLCAEGRVAA